jgi:hypothetical protein
LLRFTSCAQTGPRTEEKRGGRDRAATSESRLGREALVSTSGGTACEREPHRPACRPVRLLVTAAAVVLAGCSSTANPAGSGGSSGAAGVGGAAGLGGAGIGGMTGTGGAGAGGHEIMDAQSDGDGPATSDAGDSGLECSLGKPCHTNGECCEGEWCFISAAITNCASAPIGVCTSHRGGNCQTHANVCDCFLTVASCTSSTGMECHNLSNTFGAGDCFACVHTCGGSGQDCCTYAGVSPCNPGLACSSGGVPAGGKCQP